MRHARPPSCNSLLTMLCSTTAQLILILAAGNSSRAQTAETLSQVKKVYIESFGQENGAAELRERVLKQLRASRKLEVVTALKEADAVIKGNGSVWVTGYVSNDPHS